jgi:hypothetical protein
VGFGHGRLQGVPHFPVRRGLNYVYLDTLTEKKLEQVIQGHRVGEPGTRRCSYENQGRNFELVLCRNHIRSGIQAETPQNYGHIRSIWLFGRHQPAKYPFPVVTMW